MIRSEAIERDQKSVLHQPMHVFSNDIGAFIQKRGFKQFDLKALGCNAVFIQIIQQSIEDIPVTQLRPRRIVAGSKLLM